MPDRNYLGILDAISRVVGGVESTIATGQKTFDWSNERTEALATDALGCACRGLAAWSSPSA